MNNNKEQTKHLIKNDAGKPIKKRFYRGFTIYNYGYYPPDKCVWWEAVNNLTGEADFHAKRLRDIIIMINKSLAIP